jgi:hypothetical protein
LNDSLANAFSIECLQNEYSHIKSAFLTVNSSTGFSKDENPKENITASDEENNNIFHPPSPSLATVLSLSNLKLKPIRCKSKKIYKKKSRYRLSSIYNINPVAYDDCSSPIDLSIEYPHDESFISLDHNDSKDSGHSEETLNINTSSDSVLLKHDESSGLDTSITDSDTTVVNHSKHNRSKSLPETNTIFSTIGTMKNSNLFHQFDDDHELRSNRLNHFISQPNLYLGLPLRNEITNIPHSPTLDVDLIDIDDVSLFSDEEVSPTETTIDDNYDNYLRRSKMNLIQDLSLIEKSKLHDSILSTKPNRIPESSKFHNPISTIKISNPTVEPTIENLDTGTIHCKGIKRVSFDLKEDPKQLLSDMITRNNENLMHLASEPMSLSPKPSLIDIFNLTLSSPSSSNSSNLRTPTRRHSSTEDWTNNLLHFINPKDETPEKIRELKMKPKSKPITADNDVQLKRKPIRIPGSHSRLTIGPGNTRIINHGISSPFRKPISSKISHASLREALSQSMM